MSEKYIVYTLDGKIHSKQNVKKLDYLEEGEITGQTGYYILFGDVDIETHEVDTTADPHVIVEKTLPHKALDQTRKAWFDFRVARRIFFNKYDSQFSISDRPVPTNLGVMQTLRQQARDIPQTTSDPFVAMNMLESIVAQI